MHTGNEPMHFIEVVRPPYEAACGAKQSARMIDVSFGVTCEKCLSILRAKHIARLVANRTPGGHVQ